jgi:arylformamidase
MRAVAALLWRRFRLPVVATGHSAGGHLAACLMATDWTRVDPSLPAGLVPAAYAISGVFDLVPLLQTSVNQALRLSPADARALSPMHWPAPAGRMLDAVVGADETREHRRQCRAMAEAWSAGGAITRFEEIPSRHHFDVIAPLADPASAMTARVVALAHMAGAASDGRQQVECS